MADIFNILEETPRWSVAEQVLNGLPADRERTMKDQKPLFSHMGSVAQTLWSRRDVKEAIVIFGAAIVGFIVVIQTQLYEALDAYLVTHDDWHLDDALLVSAITSIALVIYGYRRFKDLSNEMRARSRAEIEAQRLARHDPLTGLPNRRFFGQSLEQALRHLAPGKHAAVMMLDLDGFKAVNDTHGHADGDRALLAVSELLSGMLPGGTLARMGGDEFAIIVPRTESRESIAALARRIVAGFTQPFVIGDTSVSLGVSIGIVVAPDDGGNPDILLRRADLAMYRAKSEGRSLISFYNPELEALAERRARMERDVRRAVANDTIVPHYQPLVSLSGNRIIGFEALARWTGQGERLSPDQFISLAEETGLINQLGDQLLMKACRDAVMWPCDLFLAFNVSGIQLCDPGLGLRILSILAQTSLDPRRLELEITETALVKSNDAARKVIDQLRAAGVTIALDDFGTGYATLTQLMSLHFDKIKIDRSFVQRLGKDPQSLVVVRAIIGLAKGFGLTTVGEGVEEEDQRASLQENGCAEGQGYLFSKAVPAVEIAGLLSAQSGTPKAA
jgi:diguanylate cyclase (GGDEF)-like protein